MFFTEQGVWVPWLTSPHPASPSGLWLLQVAQRASEGEHREMDVLGLKDVHNYSQGQVRESERPVKLPGGKIIWMQLPCELAMTTRKIQVIRFYMNNPLTPLEHRLCWKQRSETLSLSLENQGSRWFRQVLKDAITFSVCRTWNRTDPWVVAKWQELAFLHVFSK